jgi:hypothetical protein
MDVARLFSSRPNWVPHLLTRRGMLLLPLPLWVPSTELAENGVIRLGRGVEIFSGIFREPLKICQRNIIH